MRKETITEIIELLDIGVRMYESTFLELARRYLAKYKKEDFYSDLTPSEKEIYDENFNLYQTKKRILEDFIKHVQQQH